MIKPITTYKKILKAASERKSICYYYIIKKNPHCFTGNIKTDVSNANKLVKGIKVNNTAHVTVSALKWGLDMFYGQEFNPKFLEPRPQEVSKFTTRLDKNQIQWIRMKFNDYIEAANNVSYNIVDITRHSRIRLYYAFEALLASGMRVGELCSIDFRKDPKTRFITSPQTGLTDAEIIINTEKTCKKREVYVPEACYEFFKNDMKRLTIDRIAHGFEVFREWAGLNFRLTSHVLRRTKASFMHELGIDVNTIALVLGNTPAVVLKHYVISSGLNYDAIDLANGLDWNIVVKKGNLFFNKDHMEIEHKAKNTKEVVSSINKERSNFKS